MQQRNLTYNDFIRHLEDREYFGQKLGLERIEEILARLGDPQKKFRSIHIAGTNGKGSTATMIASILSQAGYRTGLYTSPHLTDFCERIRIGGRTISRKSVVRLVRRVRECETESLTFFELATAIAFLHFAEQKIDFAVLEVGMGGRLDATNVVTPLVSVITTIGLDHTLHLGETLSKIAFEKAGIIKAGIPVVTGPFPEEASKVVKAVAQSQESRVVPFDSARFPDHSNLALAGDHQRENAAVALAVIELLQKDGSFPIADKSIRQGLKKVFWPGRLETVSERPWVVLDGAHNPQAMEVVREFLEKNLEGRRLTVVLGAMADKDVNGILSEIVPVADQFVFTAPDLKRAMSPEQLMEVAAPFQKKGIMIRPVQEAVETVLQSSKVDDVILVTGSLFVVGEARKCFNLIS